jgi:hypothetical protein
MGKQKKRPASGPTAGAGPRRDLGDQTAGQDEVTGGGAQDKEQERVSKSERAGHEPRRSANLPGDDQGIPT